MRQVLQRKALPKEYEEMFIQGRGSRSSRVKKITYFLSIGGRLHISQAENFLICSSYGLVASSFVQILLSLKCSSVFASKALNDVSINHFLMDKILQRSHFKWFECWQDYYFAIFINNLQKSQNSR